MGWMPQEIDYQQEQKISLLIIQIRSGIHPVFNSG